MGWRRLVSRVVGGVALITTTVAGSPTASSLSGEPISLEERRALVAFYESTDGNHWKRHDGWLGPVGSECEWYGVECESVESNHSNVVALDLSENNVHGTIPKALGELVHLQTLFLFGNDLSGRLPMPLIQKWLAGSLWVNASAPQFTDIEEIDYEMSASALLCEKHRVVLRSDSSALLLTKRCQNASPKDRSTYCEVKKGRIYGAEFAILAWTLEKNGYFRLQIKYDRNITDSVFRSSRVIRNAKKYEVVEYAGGGPVELWTITMVIEGVLSSIEWEKAQSLAACPAWEKGQVPAGK